jgi:hypothetical protein
MFKIGASPITMKALQRVSIIAIYIAMIMIMCTLSVAAADTQVVYEGGFTEGLTDITAEKTVEQAKDEEGNFIENLFDVTLTVTTPEEVSTSVTTKSQDAYVVLVFDCSISMAGAPIESAKSAAAQFVRNFANVSDENITREVGLVTFGDSATSHGWFNVNNKSTTNKLDDLVKDYSGIIPRLATAGATNLDDALRKANNLLNQLPSNDVPKYVVLLSDGGPNRVSSGITKWNALPADEFTGGPTPRGMMAAFEAAQLIDEDVNLIAIAYTTGSTANFDDAVKRFWGDLPADANTTYGSIHTAYPDETEYTGRPLQTNLGLTLEHFLSELVSLHPGGGSVLEAESGSEGSLEGLFDQIEQEITSLADFWIINDTLGSSIQWYGDIPSGEILRLKNNGRELEWDLMKEPPLGGESVNTTGRLTHEDGIFAYSYTYSVRLNNLLESPDTYSPYKVNEHAEVNYSINGASKQATFVVPLVTDYTAALNIKKEFYDKQSKILPSADSEIPAVKFVIKTEDDTWSKDIALSLIQNADNTYDYYAKMDDLASGHNYKLVEQKYIENKWEDIGTWNLSAYFGVITLLDSTNTAVPTSGDAYVIKNGYETDNNETGNNETGNNDSVSNGTSGGSGITTPVKEKEEVPDVPVEEEESVEEEEEVVEKGSTLPFPVTQGQFVYVQIDGTYLITDEDGVPLGTWRYDDATEMWIFEEMPPLSLPQTGAVLDAQGHMASTGHLGLLMLIAGYLFIISRKRYNTVTQ